MYSTQIEPTLVEVTDLPLELPRLEKEFDGYQIAQISDIHMYGWMNAERLEEIVRTVNQQEPDLIVITGDFVTHEPEKYREELVSALKKLQAPDGVLAVLGNHDHWAGLNSVRRTLAEAGIRELCNDVVTLRRGEASLHIAGVDDMVAHQARLGEVLQQLNGHGAAILLAHEPDFADTSAASGRFDLQLSGHSHGGQIVIPLLPPLFLPYGAHKYPRGLYNVDGMHLYTNRGLGMVHYQARFNSRPEITIITLRAPEVWE